MTKRTKQILAIVSIVLSVAIVVGIVLFVLASCGDDGSTTTKRKKKVVIVKRPQTTQADNTSSDEDYEDDYYEEDYTEETPTAPVEEEDDGSKYEVDLVRGVINPLNEQMGMAFYHFYEGEWDALLADKFGAKEEEFMTYYRFNSIEQLRNIKEKNGLGWWIVHSPFGDDRTNLQISENWKNTLIMNMDAIKSAGLWDTFAGFETEEICMKLSQDQFRIMTKWLRDTFPDKRIFACLSVYEVQGTAPAGFTIAPMSYDTYGYITDIGYDWYSHLDEDRYRDMLEQMLTNMGRRNNVRVWFFPTSYRFSDSTDEEFVTTHLNMMYDILLDCKNPGGLYLYTWKTYSGKNGISDLLDPAMDYQWDNWGRRIIEIGKEMRASSYRYDYSIIN